MNCQTSSITLTSEEKAITTTTVTETTCSEFLAECKVCMQSRTFSGNTQFFLVFDGFY